MTTQYTPILKLALPVQGELSGTWGDVVNDNITSMIEQAIAGRLVINTWSGNSHTLTTANGTTAEARAAMLTLTDSGSQLSAAGTVVCPALNKTYIVKNGAGQIITVKTASGSGIAIPNGKTMLVYCDGTNVLEGVDHVVTLSAGTLTITGLTTFASLKGADATTVTGILDEDNMASNSATKLATQQSIKAYVDAQVDTADTLAEILAIGNTTGTTDIEVTAAQKVQFRDAAIYINSSADGQLDIVADTEIQIATATVDLNGNLDVSGTALVTGTLDVDGATQLDSTLTVGVNDTGHDVKFFGASSGSYMLWDESADDLILGGAAGLNVVGAATFTTEITANGGIALGDNDKATFGAGDDLQIYHSGSHSFIEDVGGGSLFLKGGPQLKLMNDGENALLAQKDAGVTLYHNNVAKIVTTATGIDVTGTATMDGLTVEAASNALIRVSDSTNANQRLDLTHNAGIASVISGNNGYPGAIKLRAYDGTDTIDRLNIAANGDISFYEDTGTTAKMVWDASAEQLTLSGTGGITSSAPMTITTADNAAQITLISTDADASVGPLIDLTRDSASPAASDTLGRIRFRGEDANGDVTAYAQITGLISSTSAGAVDGRVQFQTMRGGVQKVSLNLNATEAVFNESSEDYDFRVESNGNTHALFVEGSSGKVGVGTTAPQGILHIDQGASGDAIAILETHAGGDSKFVFSQGVSDVNWAVGLDAGGGVTADSFSIAYKADGYPSLSGQSVFLIAPDGSLSTPTAGTSNVRFGVNAGNSIVSGGNYNVLVGDEAGTAITTGDTNVAVGKNALQSEDTGSSNVAVGYATLAALNYNGAGYNTAVGHAAGNDINTGIKNTLIGGLAGDAITTASENVAIGYDSLGTNILGSASVAVGPSALRTQNYSSATNAFNTAVGHFAGYAVTTGVQNTLIGGRAGDNLTDADYNVAVGMQALNNDTLGSTSTAIGAFTLNNQNFTSATSTYNTAVGYSAGVSVTTGVQNVYVGGLTGDGATTGNDNTGVGYQSLSGPGIFARNTALGALTGQGITTGVENVLIGHEAGDALTDADFNVGIGSDALGQDTKGNRNVAVGQEALSAQNFTSPTDSYNTAVGMSAGRVVTTGIKNTLIGALAGDALTDADENVAVGWGALSNDTLGSGSVAIGKAALVSQNFTSATVTYNVAVGFGAGFAVTTGVQNTLVGSLAGDRLTDADANVALGYQALTQDRKGNTSVAIGAYALTAQDFSSSTNSFNTAVGYGSGGAVSSGVNNTLIGGLAGDALTTGDFNVIVGSQSDSTAVDSDKAQGLGFNIACAAGFTTIGSGSDDIRAAHGNVTWATVSDQRYKKDIVDSTAGLSFINALQPRTFKYKNLGELPTAFRAYEADSTAVFKNSNINHGFIAQEVKAAIDADSSIKDGFRLWDSRDDGSQEVAEAALIPILVKAIQELTARIEELEG